MTGSLAGSKVGTNFEGLDPNSWWDVVNETALSFIGEKAGIDRSEFGRRRINPSYPDRVHTGRYTATVAAGRVFYVLEYQVVDGVFTEAMSLVKRPFDGPEEIIQI